MQNLIYPNKFTESKLQKYQNLLSELINQSRYFDILKQINQTQSTKPYQVLEKIY